MAEGLLIQLSATAANQLAQLMASYGEENPEAMIARALGLLEVVKEYVDDTGVLTVVEPQKASSEGDEELVDLVFPNWKGQSGAKDQPSASPFT